MFAPEYHVAMYDLYSLCPFSFHTRTGCRKFFNLSWAITSLVPITPLHCHQCSLENWVSHKIWLQPLFSFRVGGYISPLICCLSWRALAWGESNMLNSQLCSARPEPAFLGSAYQLPAYRLCRLKAPIVSLSWAASLCIKYFKVYWEKDKKHERSFCGLVVWMLRSNGPWSVVLDSKTSYLCSRVSWKLYNHSPEAEIHVQD